MIINRRTLLASFSLGAITVATAQQRQWHLGFLALPKRPEVLETSRFGGFLAGMRSLGYIENKDFTLDWRFADGDVDRLDALAAELVSRKVDVLVAGSTPAIHAAQKATSTIPIVVANANDPLGTGFIDSLGKPGHNITGHSSESTDLGPKLVELLRAVVPRVKRVAGLINPTNSSNAGIAKSLENALANVGVVSVEFRASQPSEIENVFPKMDQQQVDAVLVAPDTVFVEQREQIARLAMEHRLPSFFSFRENVEAGGLMSYGQSLTDGYRRAANYVDRILKGANPKSLPIEQFSKLELVINLKTARNLRLEIPQGILTLADQVIE